MPPRRKLGGRVPDPNAHRRRRRARPVFRPRSTRLTTLLVRGSIRDTLAELRFATQREPPATAIAAGLLPTGIVATTEPLRASILETVESSAFTTQTALPSIATAERAVPDRDCRDRFP